MDVVVTGRHCELSDRFRSHVDEKLSRLEKHDHRIIRVQVEVEQERNPRQADRAVRVELTAFSKGPVIRAEAAAEDKMAALDLALDKMAAQMRRAADRRRVHHGTSTPRSSVGQALAATPRPAADDSDDSRDRQVGPITVTGDGPLVVREKTHPASPMTLDQALYEMELVGHDFYLFVDKENERPCGRLPPTRLRLRRHLARRQGAEPTVHPWGARVDTARSGYGPLVLEVGESPSCPGMAQSCHDARGVSEQRAGDPEPIRVLVVDDQELFRRGLTMLLAAEPGIEVVGEAGDGIEGTSLAATARARRRAARHPDAQALRHRGLPGDQGGRARRPRSSCSPSPTRRPTSTRRSRAAPPATCSRTPPSTRSPRPIRVVADGQSLISPSMAVKLIDEFKQMSRPEREHVPGLRLTDRELEVLRLVAKGMNNREIAKRAVHQREHRQEPRAQHPREAPAALADGGGHVRRQEKLLDLP